MNVIRVFLIGDMKPKMDVEGLGFRAGSRAGGVG